MQLEDTTKLSNSDYFDEDINYKRNNYPRWNKIIILDSHKRPMKDHIYQLDQRERLQTKIKRQKRRNLGKVTGKKKIPKNWKQIIENLNDNNILSLNTVDSTQMFVESPTTTTTTISLLENESQELNSLTFDKLSSIDWLLNQPTEIPTFF